MKKESHAFRKQTRFFPACKRPCCVIVALSLLLGQWGQTALAAAAGREISMAAVEDQAEYIDEAGWSLTFDKAAGSITGFSTGASTAAEIVLPAEIEGVAVREIGFQAFRDKRPDAGGNWERIVIPEGVTRIGNAAFWGVDADTVTLPPALEVIEENAFRGSNVTEMEIPDSVTEIGNYVWYDSRLSKIALPAKKMKLGAALFGHCSMGEMTLPDWLTDVGDIFRECSMTALTLPDGTEAIPDSAFENCYALRTITIPDGVTRIGAKAFCNCYDLSGLAIPSSVVSIGEEAFYNCDSLAEVSLPADITEIPKAAFSSSGVSRVTLPVSLETIGESAFEECRELTGVSLPAGLSRLDKRAFANSGLKSIELPESVTELSGELFESADKLESITLPATLSAVGDKAFYGCRALPEIELPQGVREIGNMAFSGCAKLARITLPEGLTTIGYQAFEDTGALAAIELPSTVESIGRYAFWLSGVTEITIPAAMTAIGEGAFAVSRIQSVTFHDSVTVIGAQAFLESDLQSVNFPPNLTSVGYEAFSNTPLTSVTIPAGVTYGSGVFYRCAELATAVFEEGTASIPRLMFDCCGKLENVTLPEGVAAIDPGAFTECNSLKTIRLPDSLKTIGDGAFRSCDALATIELPENLERIEANAFIWAGLTEIALPASVQYVGSQAFCCSNLEHAYVYGMATQFDWHAFLRDDGSSFNMWPNSMIMHAYAGSTAEQYMLKYGEEERFAPLAGQQLSLTAAVTDAAGNPVSEGFEVYWYAQGGTEPLNTGSAPTLEGVAKNTAYEYEIILGETLGKKYRQPARQTAEVGETSETVTCALEEIPGVTVSGKVADAAGQPLANARVTFTQTVNGKYTVTKTTQSGADGTYSVEILNAPATAAYTLAGYYTRTATVIADTCDGTRLALGTTVLHKLPQDRIQFSLWLENAARNGEEPVITGIYSTANLDFSLYNETRQSEISDFTVQYPYILLDGTAAQAGDEITVRVSSRSGGMTAGPVSFQLDETRTGTVKITFAQNGRFEVQGLSGAGESTVMVFDENGDFVRSGACSDLFQSESMDSGEYTLVFLEKTGLLRRVDKLSRLTGFGLKANADYVTKAVTIRSGEITTVSGVAVPELDESKLYYTVAGRAGFHASPAAVAAGQYILLRAEYELDSKYSTDGQTVLISLPEGISPVSGSVTVNGRAAAYSVSGNTVQVPANTRYGVVRLYVTAAKTGDFAGNAALSFRCNGGMVEQPLGMVKLDVTAAKLFTPSASTRQSAVTVWGVTLPGSGVSVFDNGNLAGQTTSSLSGKWRMNFPLQNNENLMRHEIYAEIENNDLADKLKTGTEEVFYYDGYVQATKITMINTAHNSSSLDPIEFVSEFDLLNPSAAAPSYQYYPAYPTFTFLVDFTENATPDNVYDACVVTTDEGGNETRVPLAYDAVAGRWMGTHEYSGYDIPAKIRVSYRTDYDPKAVLEDYQFTADLGNWTFELGEDGESVICGLRSVNVYDTYHEYRMTVEFFESEEEKLAYIASKGLEISYEDGNSVIYTPENYGEEYLFYSCVKDSEFPYLLVSKPLWPDTIVSAASYNARAGCGCTDGLIDSNTRAARQYNIMYQLKNCTCIADEAMRDQFLRQLGHTEALTNLAILTPPVTEALNRPFSFGDLIQNLAMNILGNTPAMPNPSEGVINNYNANIGTISAAERWLTGEVQDQQPRMARSVPDFQCECERPRPGHQQETDDQDANGALDPSGYVYEAVPSNRVEGVVTTLYYRDGAGGTILWDASGYEQENPLTTNANGEYAWFVPSGQWQVKAEKDGYETAYSDWLPVPPPQTEVNIAMTSNAAPEVKAVYAYTGGVRIEFSQYMDISSVNADHVKAYAGDTAVSGTLQPLDAETSAGGNEYASVFAFVPDGLLDGEVTLSVQNAKNYAGKVMTAGFHTTKAVTAEPASLTAEETVEIPYRSSAAVHVRVTPAAAGRKIHVSASAQSIASVSEQTVTTDADGKAAVLVQGNLPGGGEIRFTLDGAGLTVQTRVAVGGVDSTERCAPVSASVASGEVQAGTEVTLSAAAGADIYYTRDKTDPTDMENPSRMRYTAPLVITEDTAILAYAVQDGMADSLTTGFRYTVAGDGHVSVQGVLLDQVSLALKTGEAVRVTAAVYPENAADPRVVWAIDPASVASIAPSGLSCTVTGVAAGSAVLTATTSDGGHIARIPVSVSASGSQTGGGGGGSSAANRATDDARNLIDAIGTVTRGSGAAIAAARTAYDQLTDAQKKQVSNYSVLVEAEAAYARLTEAPDGLPFTDTAGHWAADAIGYAYENGLFAGVSDTLFCPDAAMNRAMLVTVLYRMEKQPAAAGENRFADVEANRWYTDAVMWASENSIVSGYSASRFGPADMVTREQLACILHRYARYKGYDVTEANDLSAFTDAGSISGWALESVQWANAEKLINGRTSTTLVPSGNATRAEAAQILMTFAQNVAK